MGKTIPEVFFRVAELHAKKSALLYKKAGVYFPISYKELAEKVEQVGYFLQSLGIKKGDRVAILSENRPEWAIIDLATMLVGGVVVPLHTTFSSEMLAKVVSHSGSTIVFVSNNNLLNKLLLSREKLQTVKKIIFLDNIPGSQIGEFAGEISSFSAIFSKIGKPTEVALEENDTCSIVYTSGTTGIPKGVVLSHNNFLSNTKAIDQVIPVLPNDVFLSFLPLSHILERTTGYYLPILKGVTIAYAEGPKQLLANLHEVKPTVLISVPRIFEKFHDAIWDKVNAGSIFNKKIFKWALRQKEGSLFYIVADLLAFKKIKHKFGGRLRLSISGGASLNENLPKFFWKIGIPVIEGYGLTETSPVVTANRKESVKFGTVGQVLPGIEIMIDEHKEILVKGPSVFSGYYNNQEDTREAFNEKGWFLTGDLGFMDKQGFLTIVGRRKEMFVLSGGKNIWPEAIENVINNDKFIFQSIVLGRDQKFVSALIVPDWQEVKNFLKKEKLPLQSKEKLIKNPNIIQLFKDRFDQKINPQLSDPEQIKKFFILTSEFTQDHEELTPTLKLRRHMIERHYEKEIKSLYH